MTGRQSSPPRRGRCTRSWKWLLAGRVCALEEVAGATKALVPSSRGPGVLGRERVAGLSKIGSDVYRPAVSALNAFLQSWQQEDGDQQRDPQRSGNVLPVALPWSGYETELNLLDASVAVLDGNPFIAAAYLADMTDSRKGHVRNGYQRILPRKSREDLLTSRGGAVLIDIVIDRDARLRN